MLLHQVISHIAEQIKKILAMKSDTWTISHVEKKKKNPHSHCLSHVSGEERRKRWGFVVILPPRSDPSAPVEQINHFNSDCVSGYWPTQIYKKKSTGVNNGLYCRPIELLQDYKHGARQSWLEEMDAGKKGLFTSAGRKKTQAAEPSYFITAGHYN